MYAILDCNNFYCSCERLFKPALDRKPVVVLSNNDGCIVSRSDEVKALGVQMAVPYFMARPTIEQYNVATFSSNYNLYGDLSWRVMETLRQLVGPQNVEVYSVDEAFLNLDHMVGADLQEVALGIRHTVEQWTGIKVSVGVAPSKVLCKVANHLAKKNKAATQCVVVLNSPAQIAEVLKTTPVGDLWGIGRKYARKLMLDHNIFNAWDLSKKSADWAYNHLGGVVGVRMLRELNGEPSIGMQDELVNKKMIASTRMFGDAVTELSDIREAVATYTTRAAEKLRRQHSAANIISVFLVGKEAPGTFSHRSDGTVSSYITLPVATMATHELIKHAVRLTEQLFKPGQAYKKAGVTLSGLVPEDTIQTNLFEESTPPTNKKLMAMIDNINFAMRNDLLKFATTGTQRDWKMRTAMRSQRHTTRWEELFEVS